MKSAPLILAFLFSGMLCRQTACAQTATGQQQLLPFEIRIGCGFAGQTSFDITFMKTLVEKKDYEGIIKSLNAPAPLQQLAAVIALEELAKRGVLKLNPVQELNIARIKQSTQPYSLCSGCTMHSKGIVSDIFTRDPREQSFLNPEYHIKYAIGLIH